MPDATGGSGGVLSTAALSVTASDGIARPAGSNARAAILTSTVCPSTASSTMASGNSPEEAVTVGGKLPSVEVS